MDTNIDQEVKKFNSKKVFATIGVVLVVIILITAGIWYVVQNAENQSQPIDTSPINVASSSAKAKTATTSASLDKTAGWQTYKNAVVGFTLKYPPRWVTETIATKPTCADDQAFFAPDSTTLGKCASGFGGLVGIFRTQVGYGLNQQVAIYINADYTNLVKTPTTVAGKTAEKITGTSKISNEALDQKGYNVIIYVIDLGGNRALLINYIQSPKWVDNSANFETMVSSLTFP